MNDRASPKAAITTRNELEFTVFCIESIAAKLGVTERSGILKTYIVPEYEALHTQSKDYIIDDVLDVLKEAGVSI